MGKFFENVTFKDALTCECPHVELQCQDNCKSVVSVYMAEASAMWLNVMVALAQNGSVDAGRVDSFICALGSLENFERTRSLTASVCSRC